MLDKLYMYKNSRAAKSQKGLVLFMALIALVAMSLAAAALVRSVDSGVLVAGNLAFKQSAILSAETGIARAYKYINDNAATLDTTNAGGYFNTFDDTKVLTASATWSSGNSIIVPKDIDDLSGNDTRFILQRMCQAGTTVPDGDKCLVGTGNAAANSRTGMSEGAAHGYETQKGGSDAVVYRATVRVAGPKNTVSYLQAFIY